MKTKYTYNNIDTFYEHFKQMPDFFELEKVHQLINNPDAKAKLSGKAVFKPLKLIIMTTVFITGLTSLALWLSPTNVKEQIVPTKQIRAVETVKPVAYIKDSESKQQNSVSDNPEKSRLLCINSKSNQTDKPQISNSESLEKSMPDNSQTCNWPSDTVLNKYDLFVYLTNEEFKKLGVLMADDSTYYHNSVDGSSGGMIHGCNWDQSDWITHYKFFISQTSDTACTSHRWGDPFYSQIDTLMPVVHKGDVDWFTVHPTIFEQLPARYQHLKTVYDNLKCLKKKYPDKQFVNYWDKSRNIVLEKINYIELSKEVLTKLGFQFFIDSISLVHSSYNMFYNIGGCMERSGRKNTNLTTTPYPPNPLPVIITDVKGLKQNYFGHGAKVEFQKSMFDVLVPVKVSLNEYLKCYNYDLIFWFYPTKEFIEALPENIRNTIKVESEAIIKGTENAAKSCTYFEACKSTLALSDLSIFPNPAKQSATITFSTKQDISGTIALTGMSGTQIKQLKSYASYKAGSHSLVVDLNGVQSGIYLVSIFSDKGFKTQRIIVSQ